MGELHVSAEPTIYSCIGLGSCIGVAAIDLRAGVSGMVHIMLPEQFEGKPLIQPGKFADTAIPELVKQMEAKGASIAHMRIAYAGGANVFAFGDSNSTKLAVGQRNIQAVEAQIKLFRLKVVVNNVGGTLGRTVVFDSSTGLVTLRTVSQAEKPLCNFKELLSRAS